ncbi:MAG: hypothetical protein ABIW36_13530 [Terrimesophilobacter sp.]
MGLTEAQTVFAGVTETAVNDLLRAFFTARPRHLHYGSPGFVPVTTIVATSMPGIAFPGVPGGIDWSIRLGLPRVDLHPQSAGLPPELTLGLGQLSVEVDIKLCVSCERRRDPKSDHDQEREERAAREKEDHDARTQGPAWDPVVGTCCKLQVYGVGHIERTFGPDAVRVVIDDVEIVDLAPDALESVIECLMLQVLRAVLADVRLPLETLRAGAFSLSIVRGPEIEDDDIKTYGNL